MREKRTGLKVCGVMDEAGLHICEKAGVDLCGLVTEYPKEVPWNLNRVTAKRLADCARAGGGAVRTVMVTDGGIEEIIERAIYVRPDIVQLHNKQTIEEIRLIAGRLTEAGIQTIKSVPLNIEEMQKQFYTDSIEKMGALLEETAIMGILIDTKDYSNRGSSKTLEEMEHLVDFVQTLRAATTKKLLLAGGINGSNAAALIRQYQPDYIDVMTGAELQPGVKSPEKIQQLMKMIA